MSGRNGRAGRSVLFEASFYAHWETVELLLSRGANVGDADAEGCGRRCMRTSGRTGFRPTG